MIQRIRGDAAAVKTAFWLGWIIDSNWTDPFLFAVYSLVKPLAGALILLFMYRVVSGPAKGSAYFANMYVGNAFFGLIGQTLLGMTFVILDDREYYRMIKYVFTSESPYHLYLLGRGLSKLAIAAISTVILILFGQVVLGIPIAFSAVDWPTLAISTVLGIGCGCGTGYMLASFQFFMARHGGSTSEALAGVLYLLCGILYPVAALPPWARSIAHILPLTYWAEAVRRSLLGHDTAAAFPGAYSGSDAGLLAVLAFGSIVSLILGYAVFCAGQAAAKRSGAIDAAQDY